nr:menaquinone via futalosine step 1 [Sulfurospirillum sp.]
FYKKLAKRFGKTRVKIPRYILKEYSEQRGISPKDIREYLTFISYTIAKKESNALKLFFKKVKQLRKE